MATSSCTSACIQVGDVDFSFLIHGISKEHFLNNRKLRSSLWGKEVFVPLKLVALFIAATDIMCNITANIKQHARGPELMHNALIVNLPT